MIRPGLFGHDRRFVKTNSVTVADNQIPSLAVFCDDYIFEIFEPVGEIVARTVSSNLFYPSNPSNLAYRIQRFH